MNSKVATWIALGVAVIVLGVVGYFLISTRAATAPQLPCTVGQDPNCPPNGGGQPFVLQAAVTCSYTDGRSPVVVPSPQDCESDQYWESYEFPNGRTVENSDPQTPPPPPDEPDPNEIGACFINYGKQLPPGTPPPGEGTIPLYEWYIDTYQTCLNDDDAYAFCVDENATTPDNCEYVSRPL